MTTLVDKRTILKAITIVQPWASLIMLGLKRWETRSWRTSLRGPLLIHAGATIDHDAIAELPWRAQRELLRARRLPTGAILGVAWVEDVMAGQVAVELEPGQAPYGNFGDGRFAWRISAVKPVRPVMGVRGQQGLWNYAALPDVVAAARALELGSKDDLDLA